MPRKFTVVWSTAVALVAGALFSLAMSTLGLSTLGLSTFAEEGPIPPARQFTDPPVGAGEVQPPGTTVKKELPSTTAASRPATRPVPMVGPLRVVPVVAPPDPLAVTDEQIGTAIERGAEYLMSQFQNGALITVDKTGMGSRTATGADCLAVYALMQCGLAAKIDKLDIKNAYLQNLIDTMKTLPVEPSVATYTYGIRATALAVYNRVEDRPILLSDVTYLLQSADGGHYSYTMPPARAKVSMRGVYDPGNGSTYSDNSNSQYGLLGVWSAAEAGAEIPGAYWSAVEHHWAGSQGMDGMWPYSGQRAAIGNGGLGKASGTLTMTLAGVVSMFVTQDYLYGQNLTVGREPFTPPLKKGLTWLETGNNCQFVGGYGGYALERVGLASGFKYFGTHDWYREGALRLVRTQAANGSWGGAAAIGDTGVVNVAYNLLFLARGRHPILYNKLRFDHFWANRPRDVANLCKFAGRELEHPFNWQVVSIDREWSDWLESPVLYLASHEAAKLKDADYDKIRSFVQAGGLLYTQADGASAVFNKYADELAKKLFRDYELGKLPADHEIYKVLYTLDPKKLALKGVSNGSRLLMVHSSVDMSQWWQQQATKSHTSEHQFGLNLFVYAAGKSDFRNRISNIYIPPVPATAIPQKPGGAVHISRLRYGGNWNPEPGAWDRFSRWFQWQTSCTVDVATTDLEKLAFDATPGTVQIAHLTGTVAFPITDDQAKSMRAFVEAGGVLFIDSCGSSAAFNDSAMRQLFPKAFPDSALKKIGPNHPLLGGSPSMEDVHKPILRPFASAKLGANGVVAKLEGFALGKGHVLYSWMDVATGFLGNKTYGILGYDPAYSLALMKNIVLWTAGGQKESPITP